MILIDTSVWINVFRDRSGRRARLLSDGVGQQIVATAPVVLCEVLQGALNDAEWTYIHSALAVQEQLKISDQTWIAAARIYFELRRVGKTVRSSIDCCIAQLALENNAELLHCDRDFEVIASIRPLQHRHFDLDKSSQ